MLIPFVQGEICPSGVPAQQMAENACEQLIARASSAIGVMIGVSEDVHHLCVTRANAIRSTMEQEVTNLDGRVLKNYALLISFAEKVSR